MPSLKIINYWPWKFTPEGYQQGHQPRKGENKTTSQQMGGESKSQEREKKNIPDVVRICWQNGRIKQKTDNVTQRTLEDKKQADHTISWMEGMDDGNWSKSNRWQLGMTQGRRMLKK